MSNYAPPSPLYIPLQGLQTAFINKDDGTELAGGYIKFFRDSARTVPKDVYVQAQQPDNSYLFITVGNIITLSSVGTTQNPNDGTDAQIYLFPWTGVENFPGDVDLYYLAVYSSDNILQFTREAQPPNVIAGESPQTSFQDSDNQIENPQFVETLFPNSSSNVFTVSGTNSVTPIAPDWSIVTSGTGSVNVIQENIEDSSIPSGAPFSIHLVPAGITSLKLRQTISNSPRLMGNSYISGSLVAKTYTAQPVQLIMDYVPSTGQAVNLVNAFTTADGQYSTLVNGAASLITTTNNDGGIAGFVNIDITIPATAVVAITSVQIVSVENSAAQVEFLQVSTPRQKDHLFHYYEPLLSYKPIPSHLVGWDFVLNPTQTGSHVAPQALGVNTSYYAWDQTIIFQSATSGITVDQTSTPNPSGMLSLTAAVPTQMAIIQYLEGYKCTEVLLDAINALSSNISLQTKVPQTLTVSLWWTANSNLPFTTSNQSFVNSLDANGHPSSVASGWNEIARGPIGNAQFTTGTNTLQSFGFTGWQSLTAAASGQYFAIVIGTNTVAASNYIYFNDVSLVPGSIPTPSAPKSLDQVLRECQYYYETSYTPGTVPGLSGKSSTARIYYQTTVFPGGGSYVAYRSPFDVIFNTPKRVAPTVPATANPTFHFYSPSAGTIDRVDYETYATAKVGSTIVSLSSLWNLSTSTRGVYAIQNSSTAVSTSAFAGDSANSIVLAHFSADSRLGVI